MNMGEEKKAIYIVSFFLLFLASFGSTLSSEQPDSFSSAHESPEALGSIDWPMFRRFPNHTGYSSERIAPPFTLAWTFSTERYIDSSPAVSDGRVFFGSDDGKLYALDANDGGFLWSYETDLRVRSSPAVDGEYVIFGSFDSRVYALDKITGEQVWNHTTGNYIVSAPNVVNGVVFIGSRDGYLYALNENSGTLMWKANLNGTVWASPAIDGDLVFAYERDNGYLYAINRLDGEISWSRFVNSSWSSPTVANDRVFIGTSHDGTLALDKNTGAVLWESEPVYDTGSTPAYFDGEIYVGAGGYRVYSFNEVDGAVSWAFRASAGFSSSPAVTPGYVVIGCWSGDIYVLDRATGEHVWNFTTGARINSSPAIAGGRIYIGSRDHNLYCVQCALDTIAPTTTDNYDGLWHTSDFTVTLNAADDLSGISETYYEINDGSTRTVGVDGQPLIDIEDIDIKMEYWSVDKVGNEETPHRIVTNIKLDRTAPITNDDYDGAWRCSDFAVNLTATDNLSGVYGIFYRVDDGPTENVGNSGSLPFSTEGNYKLEYWGMDLAGNSEPQHTVWVKLDRTSPATTHNYDGLWHNSDFTITLGAEDGLSGIAGICYNINNGPTMNVSFDGQPHIVTERSNNTLEYWSVDVAGNEELHHIQADIKLDKTNPVANVGDDQIVDEDSLVTLDGSASTDENGIANFTWTCISNQQTIQTFTGMNPTHTLDTPGEYMVTLKVTDMAGNYATDTAVITVRDITKPVTNANHAISFNLMVWTATFDASESSDNVGIAGCEWNFGDRSTATGQLVSHTYIDPGNYNVTLTVHDAAGNTDITSIVITIHSPTSPWWTTILIAILAVLGVATTITIGAKKKKQIGQTFEG